MKRKKISQREARGLRKRVQQLEQLVREQRAAFAREYPRGTHIGSHTFTNPNGSVNPDSSVIVAAKTARKLGHAIVATVDGAHLNLYALPLASEKP